MLSECRAVHRLAIILFFSTRLPFSYELLACPLFFKEECIFACRIFYKNIILVKLKDDDV